MNMNDQPEFAENELVLPAKDQRQPHESYDDFYRRTKKWQWLKAGFACWGIHGGLTILVAVLLVVFVKNGELFGKIFTIYLFAGWLPLIKLYPVLLRKLD